MSSKAARPRPIGPPTSEEADQAVRQLPRIAAPDVSMALANAGKSLGQTKIQPFADSINGAFRNYFVSRLMELWKANPSDAARSLQQIAGATDKLVRLLEVNPAAPSASPGRLGELQRRALLGQFRGKPQPTKELAELIDALLLWREVVNGAYITERAKVRPPRDRHKPNQPLHILFCEIGGAWNDAIGELPTDGGPSGPYIRFLKAIFNSMRDRVISTDLAAQYPELEKDLSLTAQAMRARYRDTAEAKITGFVRRNRPKKPPRAANDRAGLDNWRMVKSAKKK